jgi:hypothetical protein
MKNNTENTAGSDCRERLVSGSSTPGPWVWTEKQKVLNSAHGKIIDHTPYEGMWFARYDDAEDEANARLIAAAPEMLEALDRIFVAATRMGRGDVGDIGLAVDLIRHKAAQAITKALGPDWQNV